MRSYGKEIHIIDRNQRIYLNKKLEKYDLAVGSSQLKFLFSLYEQDEICQNQLAKRLSVDKATATRVLRKLEKADYIEKYKDLNDKRKSLIRITPKGYSIKNDICDILDEWSKALTKGFTAEEKDTFYQLLSRATNNSKTTIEGDQQ